MAKTAVVTGAGSGVGQAAAIELARQGWNVALVGRRMGALQETVKLAGNRGGQMMPVSCDVGRASDVEKMAAAVEQKLGAPQVLVAAAGTNIPNRSWDVLSAEDFQSVIDA